MSRLLHAGDASDLRPAQFSNGSVAVQGFPALERLMFGAEPLGNKLVGKEILSRCAVARAITANLTRLAEAIEAETREDRTPADPAAAARALLTDLSTGFAVIVDLKFKFPLGEAKPRPRQAESWRSDRSLRNAGQNLEALRALTMILLTGRASDFERDSITRAFADLQMDLKQSGDALGPVLSTEAGRRKLQLTALRLENLHELAVTTISRHLNIGTGFNKFDGD